MEALVRYVFLSVICTVWELDEAVRGMVGEDRHRPKLADAGMVAGQVCCLQCTDVKLFFSTCTYLSS